MLKNNTKKEVEKIIKVRVGSLYMNDMSSDCDILIIGDDNGNKRMLNAHCFNMIFGDNIEDYLKKNGYYEIEAEIVRTS